MPALKLLVDNFTLLEMVQISREVVELLAILVLVRNSDLDGGEGVEDIELCASLLAICHANPVNLWDDLLVRFQAV